MNKKNSLAASLNEIPNDSNLQQSTSPNSSHINSQEEANTIVNSSLIKSKSFPKLDSGNNDNNSEKNHSSNKSVSKKSFRQDNENSVQLPTPASENKPIYTLNLTDNFQNSFNYYENQSGLMNSSTLQYNQTKPASFQRYEDKDLQSHIYYSKFNKINTKNLVNTNQMGSYSTPGIYEGNEQQPTFYSNEPFQQQINNNHHLVGNEATMLAYSSHNSSMIGNGLGNSNYYNQAVNDASSQSSSSSSKDSLSNEFYHFHHIQSNPNYLLIN
jgi:hypothetical protein